MAIEAYPGKRLSLSGNLCTVRFSGEVTGTEDPWLGVEWDDPSKGKHAGTHNGVNYFKCASRQPNAASFVRPTRPFDPPKSLVEAVKDKYASPDDFGKQSSPAGDLGQGSIRISGKEVEEVGFEKIKRQLSNLQQLRIIIVDTLCVHRPQAQIENEALALDVAETCPKAVELDLSRNLFESWDEIIDICRQLLALKTLRVDGNRFRYLSRSSMLQKSLRSAPFTTIKTLSLDSTLLSWEQVCHIALPLSSLSSLSANGNEYSVLPDNDLPASITSISLERNEFQSVACVRSLTTLNNIRFLSLKSNRIRTFTPNPPMQNRVAPLVFAKSLQDLDLAGNGIQDWTFVDSLGAVFPALTSLRISHNPIYEKLHAADGRPLDADDGYMLTLARLSLLTRLNFSAITPKERLNAETFYLSQITQELAAAPSDEASSIIARNARYSELCQIHGQPEVNRSALNASNPNSLGARLINLQFALDNALSASVSTSKGLPMDLSLEISIPRSCSIYTALGLIGKRTGLAPMLLQLTWVTEQSDVLSGLDENEDSEEDNADDEIQSRGEARKMSQTVQVLKPRTRTLSTWFENNKSAALRVEWSQEDLTRRNMFST